MDPVKVEAIRAWLVPTTIKDMRGFLGIASYYLKFIKGFATIVAPISDFLCKGQSFEWTEAAQYAIEHLKSRLCYAQRLDCRSLIKNFRSKPTLLEQG